MKTKMKHFALIILLSVYGTANAVTYTWNGSTSTNWTVATNWTPTRTTPATSDDIVITPTSDLTITSFPTQTINSLTINGTGAYTVTMANGNNSLTIATLFDIEAGNTLDVGTLRLNNAAATFTTSGTGALKVANTNYTPTGKTWTFDVIYNGTATQQVAGGTYNNITIDNSTAIGTIAGFIGGGDLTVNGTLTLNKGILACSNNGTTTARTLNIASTAIINGASSNSYVFTSTGALSRKNVGTATLLYPMGTLANYAPLIITNTTGTPNITTKLSATITNAPADATKVVKLEWSVLSTVATTTDITYQFNTADFATAYSVGSSSELGNYKTAYTVTSVGTATGSNPHSVSATGLSIPTSGSNLYVIGNSNAIVGGTTSVSDITKESFNVEVANSGTLFLVNYSIPTASFVNVRLLNLNGQTLQTLSFEKQQIGQAVISSSNLSKGLYLVEVQIEGIKVTKKVVKY